jgi:hypothetical protein
MSLTENRPSLSDKVNKSAAIETQFDLLDGSFSNRDAMDLITRLIHVKINFHEQKITAGSSEEDIKMREKRIKELQKDHYNMRHFLSERTAERVTMKSVITIKTT